VPAVFDQAVIEAQRAARYLPASKGGEGLPSRVLTVAEFVLTPGGQRHCALKYAAVAARLNALPPTTAIDPAFVAALLYAGR
jgi:hypothetical protein